MVLAYAEDVESGLVGVLDLGEQIAQLLGGAEGVARDDDVVNNNGNLALGVTNKDGVVRLLLLITVDQAKVSANLLRNGSSAGFKGEKRSKVK